MCLTTYSRFWVASAVLMNPAHLWNNASPNTSGLKNRALDLVVIISGSCDVSSRRVTSWPNKSRGQAEQHPGQHMALAEKGPSKTLKPNLASEGWDLHSYNHSWLLQIVLTADILYGKVVIILYHKLNDPSQIRFPENRSCKEHRLPPRFQLQLLLKGKHFTPEWRILTMYPCNCPDG